MQAIRVNDLILVGITAEVFFETGLEIREGSEFPDTLVLGYTNGLVGYLPRAEDLPPDGWKVDPNFADKGYRFLQGDADDVRTGIGLSPTIDLAPGTDLQSNSLVLAIQFARPGDLCKASSFLADPSPDYATQVVEDTPQQARTMAEPGDLYAVEHIVHMISQKPCIALQIYLVTAQRHPRDPSPLRPYDRQALFALLSQITATMRPLK